MKPYAAAPFSDGMVLQRDLPLIVWGYADPGSHVQVSIQKACVETTAKDSGRWKCTLPPLQTSVCETLVVSSAEGASVYADVMVGEVWLAGGQSNMEFQMRYDADYKAAVRLCQDPLFRFYDVPKVSAPEQRKMRDYSRFGFWRKASPEDLQYFSAVAYYFGAALRDTLQVPVGIIGCNWGGTRSCCWMSRETLEKCGPEWIRDYEEGLKQIPDMEKARKAYYDNPNIDTSCPFDHPFNDRLLYGISVEEMMQGYREMLKSGALSFIGPWSEWRPNGLYEEMLSGIIPYSIAGVIWYQGESDVEHADLYADMMCGLIDEWRHEWGRDIPFIMTQLAPLGDTDCEMVLASCAKFPVIRAKQKEVTRRMKDVYLISTSDVGHPFDIHPKHKRPVGRRLALMALSRVYGLPLESDAPEPSVISWHEDDLVLEFSNAQGGLILCGERIQAMELLTHDGTPLAPDVWSASVSGKELTIHLNQKADAGEIRFAATPWYEVNLYNMAGIPAMPFTFAIPDAQERMQLSGTVS